MAAIVTPLIFATRAGERVMVGIEREPTRQIRR